MDVANTVRKGLLTDRPYCVRVFDAIAVQTKQQQQQENKHTKLNLNSSNTLTQGSTNEIYPNSN